MSSGDSFLDTDESKEVAMNRDEPKEVAADRDESKEIAMDRDESKDVTAGGDVERAMDGAPTLKRNLHNRHMQMIAIGMSSIAAFHPLSLVDSVVVNGQPLTETFWHFE
jgi:hypothetical protein